MSFAGIIVYSYGDLDEACDVLWCPENFGMLGQGGGVEAPV